MIKTKSKNNVNMNIPSDLNITQFQIFIEWNLLTWWIRNEADGKATGDDVLISIIIILTKKWKLRITWKTITYCQQLIGIKMCGHNRDKNKNIVMFINTKPSLFCWRSPVACYRRNTKPGLPFRLLLFAMKVNMQKSKENGRWWYHVKFFSIDETMMAGFLVQPKIFLQNLQPTMQKPRNLIFLRLYMYKET